MRMRMRRLPLLLVIYILVGVIVAYTDDYLENLETTKRVLSAILAVVLWPLVLVGFDVKIT
jgi:Mn2+/Fe2+ NRAMP family transporter